MTGVTPREAQAHVDKGGTVMALDAISGREFDVSISGFATLALQGTPRPQWRLVPIPEPTVTIEVPKRWAKAVADSLPRLATGEDYNVVRQACIKAVES